MNLLQQLKKADTGSLPAMEQQALQNFLHPTDSQVNEAHAYQWLKHAVSAYNNVGLHKILSEYENYLNAQVNDGFNTIDKTDLEATGTLKNTITYYNSHGNSMDWSEFVEIEVRERKNYPMREVRKWEKKYNIKPETPVIWVTKTPNEALYYMTLAQSHSDIKMLSTKEFEEKWNVSTSDLHEFTPEDGYLIPESEDGDGGYLMVLFNHTYKKGGLVREQNIIKGIVLVKQNLIKSYSSGSTIQRIGNKLYIAGDDTPNLLITDLELNIIATPPILPQFKSGERIPKPLKPDFEASVIFTAADGIRKMALFGSGTIATRKSLLVIDVLPSGEISADKQIPIDGIIASIEKLGIGEINIEGAAIVSDKIVLANRGGRPTTPPNTLLVIDSATSVLQKGEGIVVSSTQLHLEDSTLGLSELFYDETTDTLWFCATKEESANAYEDAAVGGSYLGCVAAISQCLNSGDKAIYPTCLIDFWNIAPELSQTKIEGITLDVEPKNDSATLYLVSDNDNGETGLYKMQLSNYSEFVSYTPNQPLPLNKKDTAAFLEKKYHRPYISIAGAHADAELYAKDTQNHAVETGQVRQWSKDWLNLGFRSSAEKYREIISKNPFEVEEYLGNSYPKIYVRLGLPPEDKKGSTGYYRGRNVSHNGVSVFMAVYDPKSRYITVITPSESNTMDLWEGLAQKRKLYLVEGEELDEEGTGGEPLLNPQTLKVIGELDMDYALPDYDSYDGETLSGKPLNENPFESKEEFAEGGQLISPLQAKQIYRALLTNEAYEILDSAPELTGSTWSAGGCYLLARALQRIYGGKLVTVYNVHGQPQHVAVQLGNMYLDADGLQTGDKLLKTMREDELVAFPHIGEFNEKKLGGIGIGTKQTEARLVEFLSKKKFKEGGNAGAFVTLNEFKQSVKLWRDSYTTKQYETEHSEYVLLYVKGKGGGSAHYQLLQNGKPVGEKKKTYSDAISYWYSFTKFINKPTATQPEFRPQTYNEQNLPPSRNVLINHLYSTALITKILQQLNPGESYAATTHVAHTKNKAEIYKTGPDMFVVIELYAEKKEHPLHNMVAAIKAGSISFTAPVAPVIITSAKKERHHTSGYKAFKGIHTGADSFYYMVRFSDGKVFTTDTATSAPEAKRQAWQYYSDVVNAKNKKLADKFYRLWQLLGK